MSAAILYSLAKSKDVSLLEGLWFYFVTAILNPCLLHNSASPSQILIINVINTFKSIFQKPTVMNLKQSFAILKS